MAVKEGLPATDFSKMNRDYIRNVAEGETVKDGLPATDFSRMNREYIKAVVEESGGGGIASEVFPFAAHVSYVQTGMAAGTAAEFTDSFAVGQGAVIAVKDDGEYVELTDWILVNGVYDIVILATKVQVETESDVDGWYLEYTTANWSVTVSGDAEVLTDEETSAVFVKGDCTINAEFIG